MLDSGGPSNIDVRRRELVVAGVTAPFWLPGLVGSAAARVMALDQSESSEQEVVMTLAFENCPGRSDLGTAWGFSCIVEGLDKTILFDTGSDGAMLLRNMGILGFDPEKIDVVVLSHAHADHVAGLESVLAGRNGVPVYIPKGFREDLKANLESWGAELIEANKSKIIDKQARTTGTLGKRAIVEHGLCVKTKVGWALITGCAHPGVDKMAAQAKMVTRSPIHLVAGGFHIGEGPDSVTDAIIDRFEKLGVKRVAPSHCTGDKPRARFKERLGDRCVLPGIGHVFKMDA